MSHIPVYYDTDTQLQDFTLASEFCELGRLLRTASERDREQIKRMTSEIDEIAKQYDFTGGQIAVVIQNAATEVAARPADRRRLTTADIERYALIEATGQFERTTGRRAVGFQR